MPDEPFQEPRIDDTLKLASERLAAISDSPRLDAELLLTRTLDVPRSYLIAHPEDTLDSGSVERFRSLLERRASGEPLAYISGEKEFWSLMLMVSPHTLVPRPDTEILVQRALDHMPRDGECSVLDLGTGSGAIALAIAKSRSDATVTATDISLDALAIAKENARQLDIINVEFVAGDWLAAVAGRTFDLIVSNPPYIRDNDPLLANLACEPRLALVAGPDGLEAIRLLATQCRTALNPGGRLLLEHAFDQQESVATILRDAGWTAIACTPDYAGQPRVSEAVLR